jgi:ParB/RepB/Spo0J family partition protein
MSTAPKGTTGKLTAWKTNLASLVLREGFNVRIGLGDIEQLARSIADNGIERPLNVIRSTENEDVFNVIDGHRRTVALRYAVKQGWVDPETFMVPIMITPANTTELEQTAMIARANDGKPLLPIEEATLYKRLVDSGVPISTICRECGHSDVYVRQHLDLLSADASVGDALRKGEISKTLALNIATQAKRGRLDAKALVEKAKEGKAGRRAAAEQADPYLARQKQLKLRVSGIADQLAETTAAIKEALRAAQTSRRALRDTEHYDLIKLLGEEAALTALVNGAGK